MFCYRKKNLPSKYCKSMVGLPPWRHLCGFPTFRCSPTKADAAGEQKAPAPVATPCRVTVAPPDQIPELGDRTVSRPKVGVVRLSSDAIDARLRRVFRPSINGTYKVGPEILKQWQSKNKKTRRNIEQLFQSCGYSPDRG